MSKTSFARILVEVDVTKPLVREICTRLPDGSLLVQEVIYEREPQLCSKCKRLGHNEGQCRSISKKPLNAQQHRAAPSLHNARTEQKQDELQLPRVMGAAGNHASQDVVLQAATSSAAKIAVSLVSPLPVKEVLQMAEPQGVAATTPATAVSQLLIQGPSTSSVAKGAVEPNKPPPPAKKVQHLAQTHQVAASTPEIQQPLAAIQLLIKEHNASKQMDQLESIPVKQSRQQSEDAGLLATPEGHTISIAEETTHVLEDALLAAPAAANIAVQPAHALEDAQPAASEAGHATLAVEEATTELEPKQPIGQKWRQNRRTRSGKKRAAGQASPT